MPNINMSVEQFRANNEGQEILVIHPDEAEMAFPREMQLVRVWFGYDDGHNNCADCNHGIESHKARFMKPMGAPENKIEWIGCSRCSEDDTTIIRSCFGEQR